MLDSNQLTLQLAAIGDRHWSGLACAVCDQPLGAEDSIWQPDGQMRGVCVACLDDADATLVCARCDGGFPPTAPGATWIDASDADGGDVWVCVACVDDDLAEADADAATVCIVCAAAAGADNALSCMGCGTPIDGHFDASTLPANVAWVCVACAPTYGATRDWALIGSDDGGDDDIPF